MRVVDGFIDRRDLSLERALELLAGVRTEAGDRSLALAVCVVDSSGQVIASERMDGAARFFIHQIAQLIIDQPLPLHPGFAGKKGSCYGNSKMRFHPFAVATTLYNGNRFSINPRGLSYGPTGWYDGSNLPAPAPSTVFFAAPLALLATRRRR